MSSCRKVSGKKEGEKFQILRSKNKVTELVRIKPDITPNISSFTIFLVN
jgi:hypothetical protein